jgi:hypothetical protein
MMGQGGSNKQMMRGRGKSIEYEEQRTKAESREEKAESREERRRQREQQKKEQRAES